MAEKKTTAEGRRSAGGKGSSRSKGSGGAKGSGGTGRGRGSRALSTGAEESRSGASKPKGAERQSRSRSGASKNDRDGSSAEKQLAKAETGGKPMGRPPSEEPDVFVDVPNVHVGKIEVDVERLEAHLALRAQVANLVNLVAGVHVGVDKVKINIEDVDASALLKVRLQNTYNILDRTLTTIDDNPEILQGVLDTAGTAVEQVGEIGTEATKPGGAVGELTSGVGDTIGNLSDSLGDTLTSVTDKVSPKRLVSGGGRGGWPARPCSLSSEQAAASARRADRPEGRPGAGRQTDRQGGRPSQRPVSGFAL